MKQRLWASALMSLILSCLMTAWVTWLNLGFTTDYPAHWLRAWMSAWPVAGLISFTFAPFVQKFSQQMAER